MRFLSATLAAALLAAPAHAAHWERGTETEWVDLETIVDRDGLTFADWGQGAMDPAGGWTLPPSLKAATQLVYNCATAEPYQRQSAGGYAAAGKADLGDPLFRLVCEAPARRPALAQDQRRALWTACSSMQAADRARAVESCTAFIEAAGETPETLAQVLVQRAKLRFNDDKDGAIGDLTKAIRFSPSNSAAYKTRGLYHYFGRKDSQKAISDLNRVLALSPDAEAFRIRAVIYMESLKDYPRALADLNDNLRLAPKDWQGLRDRCWVRAIVGKELDKAEADCRASLELFPRWYHTYEALGLIYLKRGDVSEALKIYDEAVKGDPDLMGPLYGRGIARLRLGQTAEGQADMAAAAARKTDIAAEYAGYGVKP